MGQRKTPQSLAGVVYSSGRARLLDLGFLEFDVLANDRIVLLECQLFSLGTGVLLGHVEKAGVGRRDELDLDGGGLGHFGSPSQTERRRIGSAGIWAQPTDLRPVVKRNATS